MLARALPVLFVLGGEVGAAEPEAAGPLVESLSFDAAGGGLVLYVKTSTPVPRFVCRMPTPLSPDVVVELPEAASRLQGKYVFDSPLVGEAVVEAGLNGATGVRIRFPLRQAVFSGIEQVGHGLLLRFDRGAPPGGGGSASLQEYRVGPGDKIEINIFGHEDLNKVVEVRGDGTINYPLIGDLKVAGRSVSEIDDEMTRILAKDYLVDPQVSVDVREYQSQWVTIIGQVRTPGRYVLKRNMRLIDLLAEAGGATREAGTDILITRRHEGGQESRQIAVSRERLLSRDNDEANMVLAHGDIVTVTEQEVFYIRGEVGKPGPYYLQEGMTVLKAISVAGGLTQFANRKDIELLRAGPTGVSEKVIVNLKAIEDGKKPDVPIRPNDTIIVPRRIF
jgi:polysaccharide export outer membrane protein